MEGILFLVLFYGGIAFLGWLFEEIGKWNDRRKTKIRDELAQKILPQTGITNELIETYQNRLKNIGYKSNKSDAPFWLDILSSGKKTYKPLVGGTCPSCKEGYLHIIKGKYGKFIGCSEYPSCHYTKNVDVAMQELKQKSHEYFMKLFNLAYK